MSIKNSSQTIKLRDLRLPEDYTQMAELFNLIEPGSTTVESLMGEDAHVPATNHLSYDDNRLLVGFGRTRVVAETEDEKMIGFGACFRAPWTEPGTVGSTFCVHPNFRSQGVGEMLLYHIEEWAKTNQASVLTSIVMDWIHGSLAFVQKRGFMLDAHVFELELNTAQFDASKYEELVNQCRSTGIKFTTLADIQDEEAEKKLYELYVETSKDNPGQYGNVSPFEEWKKAFFQADLYRAEWIIIASRGNDFAGFTQLLKTDEDGVVYTNYTGVKNDYRHRGIAKSLKVIAINAAKAEGVQTITTDSEENNAPMQHINQSFGFVPGNGHYRIVKQLKS